MIPERLRERAERGNIPAWAFGVGVIALIGLAFFAWIAISMGSQPTAQEVTQDVPLAR